MNTHTRFFIAAILLTGLTSCQSYRNMRNPRYDPMTGQVLPEGAKVTPAYAQEETQVVKTAPRIVKETPTMVQPTPSTQSSVQTPQPQPRPIATPQPTQPRPITRETGPFSTPDVTGLPSKDDLKETETSTSNTNRSSGVASPNQ